MAIAAMRFSCQQPAKLGELRPCYKSIGVTSNTFLILVFSTGGTDGHARLYYIGVL